MKKRLPFGLSCGLFGILFIVLLSIRLDVFSVFLSSPKDSSLSLKTPLSESDAWMNIFQDGRKIGYSHTAFSKGEKGYNLKETMVISINTRGMGQ